jgi:hypothetical protein
MNEEKQGSNICQLYETPCKVVLAEAVTMMR